MSDLKLHVGEDYLEITNGSNGVLQMRFPDQYDKRYATHIVNAVNQHETMKLRIDNYEAMEYPRLKKTNDMLIKALKYYSDQSRWLEVERITGDDGKQHDTPPLILLDCGKVAIDALAKAGVK